MVMPSFAIASSATSMSSENSSVMAPIGIVMMFSGADSLVFGQRLALGFGGPDERDHADQVDRGHQHRGGPERHDRRQVTKQDGRRSGNVTNRVVAEPDTRTAEPGGKEFREIDRVTGK